MKPCLFVLAFLTSWNSNSQIDAVVITSDHSYNGGYSTNIGVRGMSHRGFFEHIFTYSAGVNFTSINKKHMLGPYAMIQYTLGTSHNTMIFPITQVWVSAPSDFQFMSLKASPCVGISLLSFVYATVGYNFNLTKDEFSNIDPLRISIGFHVPF
ncbi:hypothetical protein OAK35_04050 [Crocinitomicaceae bacterium]|nr:hypothetical protein [Crocinitomicaceae bacterium]